MTIEVDLEVFSKGQEYDDVKKQLEDYVRKAESDPNMQNLKVSGVGDLQLASGVKKQETVPVCNNGTVFGMNQRVGHSSKCRKFCQ